MIAAFGEPAIRYAADLQAGGLGDLDAVISDVASLAGAHAELLRRRYEGRSSYGMILLQDPRWQAVTQYAPALLKDYRHDYDLQSQALSQFGGGVFPINADGTTSSSLWSDPFDDTTRMVVGEFCLLAGAVLVRSWVEYERLLPLMKRPRTVETIVAEPKLPAIERRLLERPGVVVWAPNRTPSEITYYAFGLREFHGDVTCVSAAGAVPDGIAARFLERSDPALVDVLATAACVLCVEPEDPGDAVAFARHGYGVVAPQSSGAYEFVRNVVLLKGDKLREVYVATMIASAQPASARAIATPPRAPEIAALPSRASELPLVSVITPTYNRRADLPIALQSIAKQTYPRIEAIVVNDGGEDVADIVAQFPFARLVNAPVNVGVHRAVTEFGLGAMTGEFVAFLSDDDVFMPDHVEQMVGAMLRAGMSIAHGNAIIRYQETNAAGEIVTVGSNLSVFVDTAGPTEALASTPIAGHAVLYRRDALDAAGGFRGDSSLGDQDLQLRAAMTFNFAYVDAVTCDWGVRGDRNFSAQFDSLPELRRMYDELYPLPDRPLVRELRERILANVARRTKGTFVFAPTITHAPAGAPPA